MRFHQACALSALAAVTAAVPLSGVVTARHVVHEKRSHIPSAYIWRERASQDLIMPVRIGLTQSNLHKGHDALMDVSDPDSPNFGKHWTNKEIADFFAPASDTIDQVMGWLKTAGVKRPQLSASGAWIEFDASAEEMEQLLKTEYHMYDNQVAGHAHVACTEYSVPEYLSGHIDLITPTLHFDGRPDGPAMDAKRRRAEARALAKRGLSTGPKPGHILRPDALDATVDCSANIVPSCLRTLYNLPTTNTLNKTTFGIVEYAPVTFLQSDLNMFWSSSTTNDAGVPIGTAPKIRKVDGGYFTPSTTTSFGLNAEADLDLEYAMDLVYPQLVQTFQVGDDGEYAAYISFNNFLDALDKSYCTYDGGDDPSVDEPFPDPGGYEKKEMCGAYKAPATLSTSYAYNEHDLTPFYEARQCYEYMKLGLAGTSFLFSSGDYGVAGNQGECINPDGSYNNGSSGMFNPSFPSVCPYVTSVGATQIPTGGSPTGPETACETVIYSGGGFSNNFNMPSYQSAAVKNYFKNNQIPYSSAQYNNSQTSRGFPDVSANGANYVIAVDGNFELVYGTSASAPTFASIITLINNQRAAKGKKSLGFLNPTLYKHPLLFNDITSGGNQGCGTAGFSAVKGWDPVTGLGTPNYKKLLPVLVNL